MTSEVSPEHTPESLPEWRAYVAEPTRVTLFPLLKACENAGCRGSMIASLAREFNAHGAWRVAQHAALEAAGAGLLTLAHYWAHQAVTLSGGDLRARIALAHVLWARRMPRGVLFQTEVGRALARRAGSASEGLLWKSQLAALNAKALAYMGLVDEADRWLGFLVRAGAVDGGTAVTVLMGARHRHNERVQLRAARLLAGSAGMLGPRPKAVVEAALRRALLRLIGTRARGV